MAASDDEDTLASFGTPLEPLEENAPRKKAVPIHEQIVTDTEGRRRFHGAFTGGFSAGYFNSVGTKEGWQPSTFVSSRSKKFEQRTQRPEDYMDDEDMGEFGIAPRRIATKEEFLSQKSETQRKRVMASDVSEGIIPGGPLLQDLVVPVKMSVGVELLKKMGWKEGQGVGPRERRTKKKVYGCSLPPGPGSSTSQKTTGNDDDEEEDIFAVGLLFAPKDVEVFTFTAKDDKHGIGYKGLDPSTALLGRDNWLGIDPVSSRVGRKGIAGEAFGVGAFEEADDNIYAQDHMSNYDVELGSDNSTGLHGWTGPPKENAKGGALSIFTARPKAMDTMKTFPPPVVPRGFDCTHKFQDFKTEPKSSEEAAPKRKILTASDRGEMLGEEPLPAPEKSVFEYLSEEDKKRVLSAAKDKAVEKVSSAVPAEVVRSSASDSRQSSRFSSHWTGHSSFKPFAKDSAKQARYEEFLKSRQGEKHSELVIESGLTEWEREREKEEFARSAALYRPLNSTMAARFTTAKQQDDHRTVYEEVPAQESSDSSDQTKAASMKMFGKLTRDSFEWHPENTLCKRFNIPNPYPGSRIVGVPKVRKPKFTLGDFIVPQEPRALTYEHSTSAADDKSEKTGTTSRPVGGPTTSDSKSGSSELPTKVFAAPSGTMKAVTNSSIGHVSSHEKETTEGTGKETQNEEVNSAPKRPSMDLFKAIFADSSSDESEASDEDEVGEEETKTDGLSIQASEEKAPEEASSSETVLRTGESNLKSRFPFNSENLNQGLFSKNSTSEEQKSIEEQPVMRKSTESEKVDSSPEMYGPALPRSGYHASSSHSFSREKYSVETKRSKEDSERSNKRKEKRKDAKKRYSDSSDSEEEYRSKHKHKHKEKKKHKRKHKSKHREEEKEKLDKKGNKEGDVSKGNNVPGESSEQTRQSDDKQILSKLKNLQSLKTGKRMRAADFM